MDRADTWTFDDESERQALARWLASDHDAADEPLVTDCLADIHLNPPRRGQAQETADDPVDPDEAMREAVYFARVKHANVGVIYVLNFTAKHCVFAHIGSV